MQRLAPERIEADQYACHTPPLNCRGSHGHSTYLGDELRTCDSHCVSKALGRDVPRALYDWQTAQPPPTASKVTLLGVG